MDHSTIKTASLSFCTNPTCKVIKGSHLSITISEVDLATTKAVAISYAWGEFNRKQVEIGHNAEGRIYTMRLGQEWDVSEFRNKLVSICVENGNLRGPEHAACWIDRLCIVQGQVGADGREVFDHAEIRKSLEQLPSIYRTLETIALMPGAICSCLKRMWETARADGSSIDIASGCLNAVGVCSFTDRFWPMQELLFSRAIRLERTQCGEIPCVESIDQVVFLAPYAKELFTRMIVRGEHSREDAFGEVGERVLRFQSNLGLRLFDYVHPDQNEGDGPKTKLEEIMVKFLLGDTIKAGSPT